MPNYIKIITIVFVCVRVFVGITQNTKLKLNGQKNCNYTLTLAKKEKPTKLEIKVVPTATKKIDQSLRQTRARAQKKKRGCKKKLNDDHIPAASLVSIRIEVIDVKNAN